jgi:hypothetical protein
MGIQAAARDENETTAELRFNVNTTNPDHVHQHVFLCFVYCFSSASCSRFITALCSIFPWSSGHES